MGKWRSAVLLLAALALRPTAAQSDRGLCEGASLHDGSMVIRVERSKDGLWATDVAPSGTCGERPNDTTVDVERRVVQCDGRKVTTIKVVVSVPDDEILLFHKMGAKNIAVTKKGHTATRLNEEDDQGFGGVLTDRSLKDDEMFEVRLDRLLTHYADSLGIGITHRTPANSEYPFWMSSGTIILYDHQLYENGEITNPNYGSNLRLLKVGDRVGVMKKSNGNLHFYVNGVDLGVAKTGIDYTVYGVLDLYGNAVQATIV